MKPHAGPGIYAIVTLRVEPLGSEIPALVLDGGSVGPLDPLRQFLPAIADGVEDAARANDLFDVRAVVLGGRVHEVDSSSWAFRKAAAMALERCLVLAGLVPLDMDEASYGDGPRVTVSAGTASSRLPG